MTSLSLKLLAQVPIYRDFLFASTISLLGTGIFDIAMPLYVWDRTHSPVQLALVSAALHLPFFVMAPFTGYCVDHFDNRKILLFSDIGQVITLLSLFAYECTGLSPVWPILIAIFVGKTLTILFETVATFHLIPGLVPEKQLPDANTWFLSSQRLIQIIGPMTGGLLVSLFGFRICIFINLLSYGATLFFVYRIRDLSRWIHPEAAGAPSTLHRRASLTAVYRTFRSSLEYIWNSALFRPFVLAMFCWNLSSLVPNTPSFTFYYRAFQNFSPARYGLVTSLFGVLGILGFLWASPLYKRFRFYGAFVGAAVWQASLASLSLLSFNHPLLLASIFALSRVGSSVFAMGSFLLRQTEVPRARVGSVNATIRMLFMSAAPLSAIAQGYIIEHFGVSTSFVLGACALWGTFWFARQVARAYDISLQRKAIVSAA